MFHSSLDLDWTRLRCFTLLQPRSRLHELVCESVIARFLSAEGSYIQISPTTRFPDWKQGACWYKGPRNEPTSKGKESCPSCTRGPCMCPLICALYMEIGRPQFKISTYINTIFTFLSDNGNKEAECSYIRYFTDEDRDGLGPTEAILCKYMKLNVQHLYLSWHFCHSYNNVYSIFRSVI